MTPQAQTLPIETQSERWSAPKRIAFRFCFIYFGLFCLTTQIVGGFFPIPNVEIDPATFAPVRGVVFWTAAHVFGLKRQLVYTGSGSGDKTFDWILAFCALALAAAATAVWFAADRKRPNDSTLYKWFRLFIRFALASELFLYGVDKAVPLQMPFPFLTRLVEPYGNFSPMGVLWQFVGASRPYEISVGIAELLGGVLLLFPRTTLLGALVSLADLTQVFILNMTYDVPVKLFSFHLLLMTCFLLAPDARRLFDLFFRGRSMTASAEPGLFLSKRANRMAVVAQAAFGVLLLTGNFYGAARNWNVYGGGRPKSPLYGIWNVKEISPSLPWRRVIFDFPGRISVQNTEDAFTSYNATIDAKGGVMSLKSGKRSGQFTFQLPARDELTLAGQLDGQRMQLRLQLLDTSKLPLVRRGFHWVQEYPINR